MFSLKLKTSKLLMRYVLFWLATLHRNNNNKGNNIIEYNNNKSTFRTATNVSNTK